MRLIPTQALRHYLSRYDLHQITDTEDYRRAVAELAARETSQP